MKRSVRIVSALLCICLLVSFAGCKKPAENPPETQVNKDPVFDAGTNTWTIYKAEHLSLLAQHPTANFVIAGEMDCTGMVWTTIPEFSGTITGVWCGVFNHTISNLVIEGKAGDTAVGLFGTLTGSMKDINFVNCTVKLPEGFSGNAGLIAGTVKADLEEIEISGLTFQAAGSNVKLGGFAGELQGNAKKDRKSVV